MMHYILEALKKLTGNGDSCVPYFRLYQYCVTRGLAANETQVKEDVERLMAQGYIICEDGMVYLALVHRYEDVSAHLLAKLLTAPGLLQDRRLSKVSTVVDGCSLSNEQMEAIDMALSHRLSLILGGAGTGKTTLIRAMIQQSALPADQILLSAPTGKAAQRLAEKTGCTAVTIHSACRAGFNADFTNTVERGDIRLLIVDEAGMISLELLTGLLLAAGNRCRIVMLGDPGQLGSVSCGNVLKDLEELGVPVLFLRKTHRQKDLSSALYHNITGFSAMGDSSSLTFDDSFQLIPAEEDAIFSKTMSIALQHYRNHENVVLLSPVNSAGELSVDVLNLCIQQQLHAPDNFRFHLDDETALMDGDPVIFTHNNKSMGYFNGDLGVFRLVQDDQGLPKPQVILPDGRIIPITLFNQYQLSLAYALTIHKVQGSEADTVILPLSEHFLSMNRSMLYTAISRARQKVILIGSQGVLDYIMDRQPHARLSTLVPRTRTLLKKAG